MIGDVGENRRGKGLNTIDDQKINFVDIYCLKNIATLNASRIIINPQKVSAAAVYHRYT